MWVIKMAPTTKTVVPRQNNLNKSNKTWSDVELNLIEIVMSSATPLMTTEIEIGP